MAVQRKVSLSRYIVQCEGYSYPGDPYVVRGSCWLSYELDYVDGLDGGDAVNGEDGTSGNAPPHVFNPVYAGFWAFVHALRNVVVLAVLAYLIVTFVMSRLSHRFWRPWLRAGAGADDERPLAHNSQTRYDGETPPEGAPVGSP